MEPVLQYVKHIHSPLYDRRLMILILKKTNGRRSFSENCRCSKIKEEHRYRHNEPNAQTQKQTHKDETETETDKKTEFRLPDTELFAQ